MLASIGTAPETHAQQGGVTIYRLYADAGGDHEIRQHAHCLGGAAATRISAGMAPSQCRPAFPRIGISR